MSAGYNFIPQLRFFQEIIRIPSVMRVILYGSRARGDASSHADIDLAVDAPGATQEDWLKVTDCLEHADTLLGVDCVRYDILPQDSPLKHNIDKDGIVLFMRPADKLSNEKVQHSFEKLEKALRALEKIITAPMDSERFNVDASIQRFEFTFELFWKLLKRILEVKGVEVVYPRDVLRMSYQGGLIQGEKEWLMMLDDRNQTSHTYDETLADRIYANIKTAHFPLMKACFMQLEQNI